MKSRKEQKTTKQPRNGKKPIAAAPAATTRKPETEPKRTIKQVIIETMATNSDATNTEMIVAVKAEFPKSAFDGRHAAWYRSQARKGLLTGTAITVPNMGRKHPKTAN